MRKAKDIGTSWTILHRWPRKSWKKTRAR